MGRLRRKRVHHARRDVHRSSRTRVRLFYFITTSVSRSMSFQVRAKDLDQIQLVDLDPKVRRLSLAYPKNR